MTKIPEIAVDGKEHAEFASDIPKFQSVKISESSNFSKRPS